MQTFRLAIVQRRAAAGDTEANTRAAIGLIEEAGAGGADLVLFPECFLTGYYCPEVCRSLAPTEKLGKDASFRKWCEAALADDSEYLERIRAAARRERIGVEITAFTKGKRRPQNSAFIIDREGNVLLKYSKVHTCDFDWERYLEGGEDFFVCDFCGLKIGTMICYDREYPESARELALQGAELILVPNDCESMEIRLKELSVRAMENMVVTAMANPPGENAGASCAFSPVVWDENGRCADNTIAVADERFEGILYADFDVDALRAYRESEFLGRNRKPKAYRHLR